MMPLLYYPEAAAHLHFLACELGEDYRERKAPRTGTSRNPYYRHPSQAQVSGLTYRVNLPIGVNREE